MKKLAIILTMILGMQAYSQKSEAGIVILGSGMAAAATGAMDPIGILDFGLVGGIVGAVGIVAGVATAFHNPHAGLNIALIGIALDADQKFPRTNVEKFFSDRYDFINNQKLIKSLAKKIESEYQAGSNEIHFTEEQIENVFGATDLTEKQNQMIKNDLL